VLCTSNDNLVDGEWRVVTVLKVREQPTPEGIIESWKPFLLKVLASEALSEHHLTAADHASPSSVAGQVGRVFKMITPHQEHCNLSFQSLSDTSSKRGRL
jgi:hypothetical protein